MDSPVVIPRKRTSTSSIFYPEELTYNAELFMGSSPDGSLGIFSYFPGGKASPHHQRCQKTSENQSKVNDGKEILNSWKVMNEDMFYVPKSKTI